MTAATHITIFRFLLIPLFVGFLLYFRESGLTGTPCHIYRWAAAIAFSIAALSDALDGAVARLFRQRSRLGSILDPLADKTLLVSALLTLSFIHVEGFLRLPIWFVVLVLGRDVILVAGFVCLHLFVRHIHARPHWTGKISTFLQMAAVAIVLTQFPVIPLNWVVAAGGFFSLVSLTIYVLRGTQAVNENGYGYPGVGH
jgi:CDP-diacylglycerol--glycerol-3-phosphate 3-phosphatidyltransferase/cardiolipin synthase